MGRQLNFYMSDIMRQEFENYLNNEGFSYLDKGVCKDVNYIAPSDISNYFYVYLYKKEFGKIYLHDTGIVKYIDGSNNPVIEYVRADIKYDEKRIRSGSLWITTNNLYDVNADRKLMTKEYNRIIRWLKKNLLYENIEVEKYTNSTHEGYTIKEYMDEKALKMIIEEGFTLG